MTNGFMVTVIFCYHFPKKPDLTIWLDLCVFIPMLFFVLLHFGFWLCFVFIFTLWLLLCCLQSKLEFLLRLQEFVEFVKVKNFIQAIAYARKHLAPWGSVHMKELQRVTATLVFRSNTNCTPYKVSNIFTVLSYDMPLCHGIGQQLEVEL